MTDLRMIAVRGCLIAIKTLLVGMMALLFLEGILRLLHFGSKPLVPFCVEQGSPALPPTSDFCAAFRGHPPTRYVTDRVGARIASPKLRRKPFEDGVLVVGDSQILGYGFPFEKTFASLLATDLLGDQDKARILASPGIDPENAEFVIRRYAQTHSHRHRAIICVLNIGNDLDEIYFRGQTEHGLTWGPVTTWLGINSYLYMDWMIVDTQYITPPKHPAGVPRISYGLHPDERVVLADAVVNQVLENRELLPPSDHYAVVLIPAEVQVSKTQFATNARYYRSHKEFERWSKRTFALATMMSALETYMAKRLKAAGVHVLIGSEIFRQAGSVDRIFGEDSHHLSPYAHRLLADALRRLFCREFRLGR